MASVRVRRASEVASDRPRSSKGIGKCSGKRPRRNRSAPPRPDRVGAGDANHWTGGPSCAARGWRSAALAAVAATGGTVTRANAAAAAEGAVEIKKSVCTHCSVGCTVLAEVQNGVWTGQEPGWDSPFNLGAHCAKGASVREHAHGERRLKYPMKLVDGKYTAHQLGRGDQRDRRQDAADPRVERPRQRLLAGQRQALERAGLSLPQVRRLLGHEQRRPPGADLPLDHGRGCRQHLGLWRDDEQLQRHPQQPGDLPDRRQPGRGASRSRCCTC